MSTKTAVITVILATLLAGGGTLGYILVFKQQDSKTEQKSTIDPPLESFVNQKQNTETGLQVQSSIHQSQPTNSENSLPEPSEFGQYNEFETAESTLYIDIINGSGPDIEQGVTAHVVYQGWLTDGTLFDQSKINEQNQIVTFPVTIGAGQVIQGWEQGLIGMKQGGKRRLIIPSRFGYGATSQGTIPANSTLVFDVELVQVDQPTGL